MELLVLKRLPWVRTVLLLLGLLVIAKINLEPHMPFYGFQDIRIDLREPVVHTKGTAEACIVSDKAESAIPVTTMQNGKSTPSGIFVEVTTFGIGQEVPKPGVDYTSKPTLRVVAYTLVLYFLTYLLSWTIWFINRRRRPAA